MKESRIRSVLEAIARRGVPEDANVWPGIEARLRKGPLVMRLQTKWSWSVVLVVLALILLTTAAYALYRYFSDPGLQAAQDAGLFTDMNTTSEPNLLTPAAPFASGSGSATMVGNEQTGEGVTLGLDWVYVEDARQAFGISVSGMEAGMRPGMPVVSYTGATPEGYSGAIMWIEGSEALRGTYLANQWMHSDDQPGGRVGMQIDIPLVRWSAGRSTPVTSFHFDVRDIEVTVPWGGGGGNSYAVRVNGLEMRMEHAILSPGYTEVRLCYQLPSEGAWEIANATAQFGDLTHLLDEPVAMDDHIGGKTEGGEACQDISFPLAAPGKDVLLVVTADGLAVRGTGQKIDSTWQFSTYLPADLRIRGIQPAAAAQRAPLPSETVGDLTATLESAYLDSNRMAFSVHFDGWQDGYSVGYVSLRLADGTELNVGADFQPAESDPGTSLISLTPATELKMERLKGQLIVDLNTSPSGDTPVTEFAFDLDLPVYQALTIQSGQTQTANGQQLLLQQVKITPSYSVAYVCYRKPNAGDWMVGDSTSLQIGYDQAGVGTYAMMYDSEYGDVGKGLEPGWKMPLAEGRCVKLGFPVGYHAASETLVLRIDALQQSTPEMIPEGALKQALDKLRAQGIEMDWMTFTGTGGGGGGPVYKKLPEGVTESEAYRRFLDALGFARPGPWVFTLQIKP